MYGTAPSASGALGLSGERTGRTPDARSFDRRLKRQLRTPLQSLPSLGHLALHYTLHQHYLLDVLELAPHKRWRCPASSSVARILRFRQVDRNSDGAAEADRAHDIHVSRLRVRISKKDASSPDVAQQRGPPTVGG